VKGDGPRRLPDIVRPAAGAVQLSGPDRLHFSPASSAETRGRNTWTAVSFPGAGSNRTNPPARSTTCLTTASPSPLPRPAGLVVKNGSKPRSSWSAGMPTPSSRTSIRAQTRGAPGSRRAACPDQLGGQVSPPLPGVEDVPDQRPGVGRRVVPGGQQLGGTEDDRQQVLEVVGHPGGERAQHLQPVDLGQLLVPGAEGGPQVGQLGRSDLHRQQVGDQPGEVPLLGRPLPRRPGVLVADHPDQSVRWATGTVAEPR
jgi:hypothetical protein